MSLIPYNLAPVQHRLPVLHRLPYTIQKNTYFSSLYIRRARLWGRNKYLGSIRVAVVVITHETHEQHPITQGLQRVVSTRGNRWPCMQTAESVLDRLGF